MQCEIRETLSGYGILLQFGNRDSPKFAHTCEIGKEKDIQDGDDGSSGCEIPEKRERECRTSLSRPCQQYETKAIMQASLYSWTENRFTTKHAQVTCSRWTSAVLKERARYYVTALSWQPMGFLVMLCKIARSFAGWDPRDTMLLVLKNSCQTGTF